MTQAFTFPQSTRLFEPFSAFKPHAYCTEHDLQVFTKGCDYTQEQIPGRRLTEIFWEKNRPWCAPWKNCVGFSVHCGPALNFSGDVLVTDVLDWIERESSRPLEKYRAQFYRAARGITVHIPT